MYLYMICVYFYVYNCTFFSFFLNVKCGWMHFHECCINVITLHIFSLLRRILDVNNIIVGNFFTVINKRENENFIEYFDPSVSFIIYYLLLII